MSSICRLDDFTGSHICEQDANSRNHAPDTQQCAGFVVQRATDGGASQLNLSNWSGMRFTA
jgi:hypothetical protein